jgi:DNA-binding response OmpR family regulator
VGITFRVLVVDDNQDAADALALMVHSMGYDAECAYDAETALKIAENYQPHVLLLDILMPGIDGYELAMRLRNVVNLSEATLIAVTGLSLLEDKHKGWDSGFHYYMVKPVKHDELKKILVNLENNLQFSIQPKSSDLTLAERMRRPNKA